MTEKVKPTTVKKTAIINRAKRNKWHKNVNCQASWHTITLR